MQMTPNQTRGQFQRGNSCNQQQRPMTNYSVMQSRTASPCSQPQGNSASCQQPQPRPASSCCPPTAQRPVPPCAPPQRPTPPCPPPQRPTPPCPGPSRPWDQMTQEQLLKWITLTKFACVDANLYRDTHPCDREALAYFQEYNRLYQEAMDEYAKSYGPLTISHARHCDTYWDWVNQPWPWQ